MTLRAEWGKVKHDAPDVIYTCGQGCHRTDTRLLHGFLSSKWYSVITKNYEPSFLEELQARGYDITTLKFEIKKTAPKEGEREAKDL